MQLRRVTVMKEQRTQYVMFLYYVAKLFGLAPFTVTNNRAYVGSSEQVIYPLALSLSCVPAFIKIATQKTSDHDEHETDITSLSETVARILGSLGSVVFLMIFVLKRRKLVGILNAFQKFDDVLRTVGVEQNHEKCFKSLAIIIGTASCIITLVVYVSDVTFDLLMVESPTLSMILLVVINSWITLVQYHATLVFIITMELIRQRFHQINDLFSNICTDVDVTRSRYVLNIVHQGTGETRICMNPALRGDLKPLERLRQIEQLHDNLRRLTDAVLELFYMPIMGALAFYFTIILDVCYYIYAASSTILKPHNYRETVGSVALICWLLVTVVELFVMASVCASIQKTVRILTNRLRLVRDFVTFMCN